MASPPQSTPSADAAKSSIDGCRPGEKCQTYSRMPAYTQKPPMIHTPPRPRRAGYYSLFASAW
jgi:hypothetical protein